MTTSSHQAPASAPTRDPSRSSGVRGTFRDGALGDAAEGLEDYLRLRLGSRKRARLAFRTVTEMIRGVPAVELLADPGPKAQLYRMARSLVETERAMPETRVSGAPPPPPDETRPAWRDRTDGLGRLRSGLSPGDLELLELHHARGLSIEELSYVLERPVDEVELGLDTGEARARRLLADEAPDIAAAHPTILARAFAMEHVDPDGPTLTERPPEDVPLGTILGGRYRLVERVGVGSFGDVFRAEDQEVEGHVVALKLLREPARTERARRHALKELRLNAAVFHPSLVQFKDHGWFEQRLWFVMPWYEGESLQARIDRGPLALDEARRIFEPLARALAAMHAVGIRHQDIKPDNILLTEVGEGSEEVLPVLIDLGVAAEAQDGLLGGTPVFFAPEVAARFLAERDGGGPAVGPEADVFALALTLRDALEPETMPAVDGPRLKAFLEDRARGEAPTLRGRPRRFLRRSFRRWLHPEPASRPTAADLAHELAVLTRPRETRRQRIALVRWLVPVLCLVAMAGFYLNQRAEQQGQAAREARAAEADVRAQMERTDARRRALEATQAELQQRYEQGRLSREDLAGRLARVEGELGVVEAERDAARSAGAEAQEQARRAEAARAQAEQARETTARQADELEARLTTEERRAATLERDLRGTRDREAEARRQLAETGVRAAALEESVAAAIEARTAAERRADALTTSLRDAQRQRDRAVDDVRTFRRQLARLAGSLAGGAEPETAAAPMDPAPEER